MSVSCIVEGHGDVQAVPILVRRVAESIDPPLQVHTTAPLRVGRYKLLKEGELERAVEISARKTGGRGAVLILVDSEDDCPAELAPMLLGRARRTRPDVPIGVVLAKREFEAWFLAAAKSIRGKRGLATDLAPPVDPESIRGAKEWLGHHMGRGRKYVETLDQPALTAVFDLSEARGANSFDKCYREITHLIRLAASTGCATKVDPEL